MSHEWLKSSQLKSSQIKFCHHGWGVVMLGLDEQPRVDGVLTFNGTVTHVRKDGVGTHTTHLLCGYKSGWRIASLVHQSK